MAKYQILTDEFDPQTFYKEFEERFRTYPGKAQLSLVDAADASLAETGERLYQVEIMRKEVVMVRANGSDHANALAVQDKGEAWKSSQIVSVRVEGNDE